MTKKDGTIAKVALDNSTRDAVETAIEWTKISHDKPWDSIITENPGGIRRWNEVKRAEKKETSSE